MTAPNLKNAPRLASPEADATADSFDTESLLKRFKAWLRMNLRDRSADNSLKEALEEVLEEHEEDGQQLAPEEQNILKNVLTFGELAVRDIMTPRADIKGVEYNTPFAELKTHIALHSHTRIPVYNDTLDNVKGFIHIKDLVPLLSGEHPFNMALILRDILCIPPSMKLINLLLKMRVSGVHMAIVIDEYGGTDGLVTLEDVFEEIVGDIQDEHDEDEHEAVLSWSPAGTVDVDALVRIEKLEADLALPLSKEEASEYDTLGGLIFYRLGRVPAKNEMIEDESGVRFEILAADPRRIRKVRIYAAPVPATPEAEK